MKKEQPSRKCNCLLKKFTIRHLASPSVSFNLFVDSSHSEFPKNQSKILSNIKRDSGTDDEKGQIRASLFVSSETVKLAKHGRIQNKDLAIEVCAQDWQHKYEQIWAKYEKERIDAEELRKHLLKKQKMYIFRE